MNEEKIRQVLRHGTWLYGGVTKSDVWIVRQNYFEGPKFTDEEPTPGYPPTDSEGCFYLPQYRIPGAGAGGGGEVFSSIEDAIRRAEAIVGAIAWDDQTSN
jgi:hypothetical protein